MNRNSLRATIMSFCLGTAVLGSDPAAALSGLSPDELITASRLAVRDFLEAQSAHADHFVGFKSWKSGDGAKVKIYVTHGTTNMEFNYDCMKHGTELMCHSR